MPISNFENLPSKETPISAEVLEALQTNLLQMVFPVGSIYWNIDSNTDPAKELGFGEWKLCEGVVFVSASRTDEDFYVGVTGGEKEHTITEPEMPRHDHTPDANAQCQLITAGGTVPAPTFSGGNQNGAYRTSIAGGSQPMNMCQPYEVPAFAWRRIS